MNTSNSEIEELKRAKEATEDELQNLGTNQYIYSKERKELKQVLKEINKSLESAKLRNKKFQDLEKNYEQATGQLLRENTLSTVRC